MSPLTKQMAKATVGELMINPYQEYSCTLKSIGNMLEECKYELSQLPSLEDKQILAQVKELTGLVGKVAHTCGKLEHNKKLIRKSNNE